MTDTKMTADLSLPSGAVSIDSWQEDNLAYRIFSGPDRWISGIDGVVGTSAIQLADGTIDDGSVLEAPCIWVGVGGNSISSTQARQLAEALVAAANEVDGWVAP